MRYGVHLCYDGTDYAGWQRQINALSIQQELEEKLSILLKKETPLTGCGRTDTGVHAFNFFAHFDSESIANTEECVYHWNAMINSGIHVFNIFTAPDDWSARFSATKRTYRYILLKSRNPFLSRFACMVPYPLDIDKMQKAASALVGTHDFTSFAKLHGGQNNGICKVQSAEIIVSDDMIVFEISADRFIRNMVRAVTGTLLDIGRGRMSSESIDEILLSLDRSRAGASVPAHGLFLSEVHYENNPEIPENKKTLF